MSIPRRILFGKLDATLFRAVESATAFAKLRGNPYVELVHWLHQVWQLGDSDLHRIVRQHGLDAQHLERDLASALASLPAGATALNDFSEHIGMAVERAWIMASLQFGDHRVRGAWLMAALLETTALRRVLVGISPLFAKLPVELDPQELAAMVAGSPEDHETTHDGAIGPAGLVGNATAAEPGAAPDGGGSALSKYCKDLTAEARGQAIDPVVGRQDEIRAMTDILLRRRQNNPLLTGEAGVGKTAVVEGLALAIATGDVPPALRDVRLLSLDVGALIAGAGVRGEFESRLKALLHEAGQSALPVVLFIDEIHTLIGAGGQAGTGDAANLLKPALARGSLRTIGATTWSEYKKHIEKDAALTRRFQVLQVLEPGEGPAVEMLRGLVGTFKAHHGVDVLDEAVRAAVALSMRYLPSRQLPDKAISLLDTACARVGMSLHTPPPQVARLRQRIDALRLEVDLLLQEQNIPQGDGARTERIAAAMAETLEAEESLASQEQRWQEELALVQAIHAGRLPVDPVGPDGDGADSVLDAVTRHVELAANEKALTKLQQDQPMVFPQVDAAVVAAVIADWTGIPVGRMLRNEVAAVFDLRATLEQRVVGQAGAITAITERVQTARAKLTDPAKPVGVFLLIGPSGVGKTETALALAEAIYGGAQNLITINMSEFQEAHTVSTLKGAPPGYVGYGEGGVLTEAVRRRPYSVILLDEVEKAHPDVHEIFYQVFDKGSMEDGEGRRIDFRHTTILLTSNTGSELIASLCGDPVLTPDDAALRDALQPALRKVFPAAFIGRLTVVPYLPLAADALSRIVSLHLQKVADRMQEQHGIALGFSPAFIAHIIAHCGTHETGARRLIGFIEQHLLPRLARLWLNALQDKRAISSIEVDVRHGGTAGADVGTREGEAITCEAAYH